MGTSKQTQTTDQNYNQTVNQTQGQTAEQLQAQQSATQNLQTFLQNFMNNTSSQQGTTQNTNQTTSANLAPFQQPVVSTYFDDLMKQYQSGGLTPEVYNGPRVASATPAELAARTMATDYATGAGSGFADAALGANRMLLDPNIILNPQNVPGMQATRDALTRSVTRNLTENILPQIRNSSSFAGGYGDNRQGIAEGLAIGRTGEAIAGALGNLDLGVYNSGLSAMQNALGLAPQTYNVGTSPANTMSQVGAAQRADEQATINAGREQFAEQQAASPANVLSILQQLMGVQGQYGGTQNTTGAATGTQTGTQTQTGQQSSTQFAQQLASMLGITQSELDAYMTANTKGTQRGTGTTTNSPSTLQQIAAIAGIAMLPFTFGGSGQAGALAPQI